MYGYLHSYLATHYPNQVYDYLLNDKEVVREADSYDRDALLLTQHGTHAEREAEREPKSTSQSCKNHKKQHHHVLAIIHFVNVVHMRTYKCY